jgi:hypothetical protein
MQDLRYPIGKCPSKPVLTPDERRQAIEAIAETPNRLNAAIAGLSPEQLDTPYRAPAAGRCGSLSITCRTAT